MKIPIAVIVSANTEWKAVKSIFARDNVKLSVTPFDECFFVTVNKVQIGVFFGGWGKISAAASAQYIIDNYKPELLINLGTCGGFSNHTESGELILVTRTLSYDIYEKMFDPKGAVDFYATDIDTDWLDIKSIQKGIIVSGDKDIDPVDVNFLHKEYNAKAGDWESAAIAFTAKRNKTRLIIIRGVSDIISETHGEAYLDSSIFTNNTVTIMNKLFNHLPEIIDQFYNTKFQKE